MHLLCRLVSALLEALEATPSLFKSQAHCSEPFLSSSAQDTCFWTPNFHGGARAVPGLPSRCLLPLCSAWHFLNSSSQPLPAKSDKLKSTKSLLAVWVWPRDTVPS